jgi:hypothetical protein
MLEKNKTKIIYFFIARCFWGKCWGASKQTLAGPRVDVLLLKIIEYNVLVVGLVATALIGKQEFPTKMFYIKRKPTQM